MQTTHNLDFWVNFLKSNLKRNPYNNGDFKKKLSYEQFSRWFKEFIDQASMNLDTGRSRGDKLPSGLSSYKVKPFRGEALFMNGALGNHYGQGAASHYPYFSWHFVSIYFDTKNKSVLIGVELESLKASDMEAEDLGDNFIKDFDNKGRKVAIYFDEPIGATAMDTTDLYQKFVTICEKILLITQTKI